MNCVFRRSLCHRSPRNSVVDFITSSDFLKRTSYSCYELYIPRSFTQPFPNVSLYSISEYMYRLALRKYGNSRKFLQFFESFRSRLMVLIYVLIRFGIGDSISREPRMQGRFHPNGSEKAQIVRPPEQIQCTQEAWIQRQPLGSCL